jgi:phospholipid/cholesterol/gamma-HCH transport system ATP-binding protein
MPATKGTDVIDVRDLVTRFGSQVVHDHLNLTVRHGEVLAFVGGSGSGKTTLLREILLLLKPTSGSIRVFGQEVVGMSEQSAVGLRRRMGVLFQSGALFGGMSVLHNVGFPLKEFTKLTQEAIDEIALVKLALAGLSPDVANKVPAELSGGMRKRVALARAIASDPELLFLDEPTSGLDPSSANGLDELIVSLKNSLGLTVLMVTHDLDSIDLVADRVAVLGDGKVLAVGPVDEVSRADHPIVRDYFHGPRARRRV